MPRCHVAIFAALFITLNAAVPALALQPDQIALVVSANVPQSRKLAEFYAAQRHIPDGRIIELPIRASKNLDAPMEDISPEEYDAKVIPTVREFLKKNELENKVTCLVTFWGVPLRIDRRIQGDAEKKEVEILKSELDALKPQIVQQVQAAETLAKELDPEYHVGTADDLDNLARRGLEAMNSVLAHLPKVADAAQRGPAYTKMTGLVRDLAGQPALIEKQSQPSFLLLDPKPPTADELLAARQHEADTQRQINALAAEQQTPETRAKLRELFKNELGSLNLAHLIASQSRLDDTTESEAAFDSELALLWWPSYPKAKWTANPLNWHLAPQIHQLPAHTLMVTRLDGATAAMVHELITTSLRVETAGLRGCVVIDARGKPMTEQGYGPYDQGLRNLADLLRNKTSLKVDLDNTEALIREDSEREIAIYCGWYSLRHFVSPGQFNDGAVGFHVASSEMVSLHNPGERGWCVNLMQKGVVATLGPVAEPYLQSFPPAEEFFPLLMTGKLTLAEVYWKTTPWTSWMQCCVGDPLYRPYATNPPLKPEDLPANLKSVLPAGAGG